MIFPIAQRVIQLPQLPSVSQQLRNAGAAVARNIRSIAAGNPPGVLEATMRERQATCEACSYFRTSDQRCAHPQCGCFAKVKTWLFAEKCPDGKWKQ